MSTPVKAVPTVTEELLDRVAADPDWTARVLCAAASALNTLTHAAQPDGFVRPGAEHFGASEVLLHAFTDWDRVRSLLDEKVDQLKANYVEELRWLNDLPKPLTGGKR